MCDSEYDEDFEENGSLTGYSATPAALHVGQLATLDDYAAVSALPYLIDHDNEHFFRL